MAATRSEPKPALQRRNNEFLGDLAAWNLAHCQDNSRQMERLRHSLRQARKAELTPRQNEVVSLYYDQELTVGQIAEQLRVNKSSVSRILQRARARLKRCLRYCV